MALNQPLVCGYTYTLQNGYESKPVESSSAYQKKLGFMDVHPPRI